MKWFILFFLTPVIAQADTCGLKRYCTQMKSCKEAYYYYTQCHLDRLDGDRDDIPCEKLCGKTISQMKKRLK
ncbi:MAG: excalibur calcium-binding domain-containing protein [Alphaproteobacteria bacterium]|nr:excalibur calcium-binding domain-containing protein [Alphaproteobacteria bacterium]